MRNFLRGFVDGCVVVVLFLQIVSLCRVEHFKTAAPASITDGLTSSGVGPVSRPKKKSSAQIKSLPLIYSEPESFGYEPLLPPAVPPAVTSPLPSPMLDGWRDEYEKNHKTPYKYCRPVSETCTSLYPRYI